MQGPRPSAGSKDFQGAATPFLVPIRPKVIRLDSDTVYIAHAIPRTDLGVVLSADLGGPNLVGAILQHTTCRIRLPVRPTTSTTQIWRDQLQRGSTEVSNAHIWTKLEGSKMLHDSGAAGSFAISLYEMIQKRLAQPAAAL